MVGQARQAPVSHQSGKSSGTFRGYLLRGATQGSLVKSQTCSIFNLDEGYYRVHMCVSDLFYCKLCVRFGNNGKHRVQDLTFDEVQARC